MQQTLFEQSTAGFSARNSEYHARNLVARLGNGAEWEYTGDCTDDPSCSGVCACKHIGLRKLFTIRNPRTGDMAIVGSKCVETFWKVNPEMVARIQADAERLEREAAERLKAARELAQSREIEAAIDAFDIAAWDLASRLAPHVTEFAYRHYDGSPAIGYRATRRVRRDLWEAGWTPDRCASRVAERVDGSRFPKRWKAYKSKAAFLKHVKAETAFIETLSRGPLFE